MVIAVSERRQEARQLRFSTCRQAWPSFAAIIKVDPAGLVRKFVKSRRYKVGRAGRPRVAAGDVSEDDIAADDEEDNAVGIEHGSGSESDLTAIEG
jgi:hypothetical protein